MRPRSTRATSSRGTSSSCSASTRSSGCSSTRSGAGPAPGRCSPSSRSRRSRRSARRAGLILAVQELGSLGLEARRDAGAEGALPAEARLRRVAVRVRADRGGLRLRLGRDAHDRPARGRRVRARRRQALHHERGGREPLHRLREDRPGGGSLRDLRVRRRGGLRPGSRSRGSSRRWGSRARRRASSSSTAAGSRRRTCSAAEGEGFRIAMRILDRSRPGVAAQGLGIAQGATDYALEYAKTRETMGKPIGAAPADRGQARRHGDEVRGGARPALPLRADGRRGRPRRRS